MSITNLILSAVAQLVEPTLADGDVAPLSLNSDGRLRVSSKPGQFPIVSGSLTAAGQALSLDVTDASNVVFHIKNTGTATLSAGAFAFEGSIDSTDGVDGTWFGIQGVLSNANTIQTATPTLSIAAGAGAAYSWEASVNAMRWMRIRCTTTPTASSIATWTMIRGSYATEPIPGIQTHAVTGSGTFTVSPASASGYSLVTAATTNNANIKTTATTLSEISVFNTTAALIYVKLYNKASAPTVGTDVPLITIPVAPGALFVNEFGQLGKRFTAGLGIAVTAGPLATDTAAVAVGAQISASYV